jgi:hypothetical protein
MCLWKRLFRHTHLLKISILKDFLEVQAYKFIICEIIFPKLSVTKQPQ